MHLAPLLSTHQSRSEQPMSSSGTTNQAEDQPSATGPLSSAELDGVVGGYLPVGYSITEGTDEGGRSTYTVTSPSGVVGTYSSWMMAEAAAYHHVRQNG
jgi:hypothetical protein